MINTRISCGFITYLKYYKATKNKDLALGF